MTRMLTVLMLCSFLASCSHTTDPGECEDPRCFFEAITLEIDHVVEHYPDSLVVSTGAQAVFRQQVIDYPDFTELVNAGVVLLNGVQLSRGVDQRYDHNYYMINPDSDLVQLAPAGAFNFWKVEGSRDIPAFIDSIATPADSFRIISPRPGDTVSVSRDLNIEWTSSGLIEGSDSVVNIGIVQGEGYDRLTLGGWGLFNAHRDFYRAGVLRSAGFYRGPATVSVQRIVAQHRFAPSRIHYAMRVTTAEIVHIVLVD